MFSHKSPLFATVAALATLGFLTNFASPASAQDSKPKYSADIPSYITTPDEVKTRIGTLRFHYGTPDKDTVNLVYNVLDFYRGIATVMSGMSAPSVLRACTPVKNAAHARE